MNSVEQMGCSERHIGLHIRLVSGFNLEIITEFELRMYLLLLIPDAISNTG